MSTGTDRIIRIEEDTKHIRELLDIMANGQEQMVKDRKEHMAYCHNTVIKFNKDVLINSIFRIVFCAVLLILLPIVLTLSVKAWGL